MCISDVVNDNGVEVSSCTAKCFWPDRDDPGGLTHCYDKYKFIQLVLCATQCIAIKLETGEDNFALLSSTYGEDFLNAYRKAIRLYAEVKASCESQKQALG